MARHPAKLISVAQLARLQGVSRGVARRRLRAADAKAGGGIIIRLGRGRTAAEFTTLALLAQADPRLLEETALIRSDVEELKAWKLKAHAEIQRLRARVRELEDLSKMARPGTGGAAV